MQALWRQSSYRWLQSVFRPVPVMRESGRSVRMPRRQTEQIQRVGAIAGTRGGWFPHARSCGHQTSTLPAPRCKPRFVPVQAGPTGPPTHVHFGPNRSKYWCRGGIVSFPQTPTDSATQPGRPPSRQVPRNQVIGSHRHGQSSQQAIVLFAAVGSTRPTRSGTAAARPSWLPASARPPSHLEGIDLGAPLI